MSFYYALDDGQQEGPVEESEFRALFIKGVITPQSLIWHEELEGWTSLESTKIGLSLISNNSRPVAESKSNSIKPASNSNSSQISQNSQRLLNTLSNESNGTSVSNNRMSVRRKSVKAQAVDLNSPDQIQVGSRIWVEDSNEIWAMAEVKSLENGIFRVQKLSTGETFAVKETNENHRINPNVVPDMTSLNYIHEPGIMQNLKERYQLLERGDGEGTYTYMASVLIAMNPLRRTPDVPMELYHPNASSGPISPHPFFISETAFQQLTFSENNQAIVISGESGSGKTESAKIVLKYLVSRSSSSSSGGMVGLDERLLQSSPILESFGNAKTCKNNNSSRFGKFLKLIYSHSASKSPSSSPSLMLLGAVVETYLLEKSRLIRTVDGERNYHIFYHLLSAIRDTDAAKRSRSLPAGFLQFLGTLPLNPLVEKTSFLFLNEEENPNKKKSDIELDDIPILHSSASGPPPAAIKVVCDSLTTVGFSDPQVVEILRILLGLLYLGNIEFAGEDSPEGSVASIQGEFQQRMVETIALLFGIEKNYLLRVLMERTVVTRGETFRKRLTPMDAGYARDAVAKSLYEGVFQYLVEGINVNLSVSSSSSSSSVNQRYIGVLDIFGFENFVENQFEQLLINFANEALQNTFNKQVFESELTLYRNEGIESEVSTIPENTGCLLLISDKMGILPLLDATCRTPKAVDARFIDEIHKNLAKNEYYVPVHPKDKMNTFSIKHYAAVVKYTVPVGGGSGGGGGGGGGKLERRGSATTVGADTPLSGNSWLAKNNDSCPDELSSLCSSSSLQVLSNLNITGEGAAAPAPSASSSSSKGSGPANSAKRAGGGAFTKPTIAQLFSKSMNDLNSLLLSSSCQFIRCIKPNKLMQRGLFENTYVVNQLRSLGVLQTCEVLKVGLPTRVSYQEFVETLPNAIATTAKQNLQEAMDNLNATMASANASSAASLLDPKFVESSLIACILRAYEVPPSLYRLGKTKVFFKAGQLSLLDRILRQNSSSTASAESKNEMKRKLEESIECCKRCLMDVGRITMDLSEAKGVFNSFLSFLQTVETKFSKFFDMSNAQNSQSAAELIAVIDGRIVNLRKILDNVRYIKLPEVTNMLDMQSDLLLTYLVPAASSSNAAKYKKFQNIKGMMQATQKECESMNSKVDECQASMETLVTQEIPKIQDSIDSLSQWEDMNKLQDVVLRSTQFNSLTQQQVMDNEKLIKDTLEFARKCDFREAELKRDASTASVFTMRLSIQENDEKLRKALCIFLAIDPRSTTAQIQSALATKDVNLVSTKAVVGEAHELISSIDDIEEILSSFEQKCLDYLKTYSEAVNLANELKAVEDQKTAAEQEKRKKLEKEEEERVIALELQQWEKDQVIKDQQKAEQKLKAEQEQKEQANQPGGGGGSGKAIQEAKAATNPTSPETNIPQEPSTPAPAVVLAMTANGETLPPGWKEYTDKASGRLYYANKALGQRQWKRPIYEPPAAPAPTPTPHSEDSTSATEEQKSVYSEDSSSSSSTASSIQPVDRLSRRLLSSEQQQLKSRILSLNLSAEIEKNQNQPNPSLRTGGRTSVRFSVNQDGGGSGKGVGGIYSAAMAAGVNLDGISSTLLENPSGEGGGGGRRGANTRSMRIKSVREENLMMLTMPETAARLTVTLFNKYASEVKTGYMMKQSKLFQRWRTKFFVLEGGVLTYYDKAKEHEKGLPGKTLQLRGTSVTSFTSKEKCFFVRALGGSAAAASANMDDPNSWYLMAQTDSEMEDWMAAINAHIHGRFVSENTLSGDFWDQGTIQTQFWKVPKVNTTGVAGSKLPVGIRTLPFIEGPRTGEGIFPGEVVEIVQFVSRDGNNYLRLGDDRGWVFENHPQNGHPLLTLVRGRTTEDFKQFYYPSSQTEPLPVFMGPCLTSDLFEMKIQPGSTIEACMIWKPENVDDTGVKDALESSLHAPSITFIKLTKHLGWVAMEDLVTGACVLDEIIC